MQNKKYVTRAEIAKDLGIQQTQVDQRIAKYQKAGFELQYGVSDTEKPKFILYTSYLKFKKWLSSIDNKKVGVQTLNAYRTQHLDTHHKLNNRVTQLFEDIQNLKNFTNNEQRLLQELSDIYHQQIAQHSILIADLQRELSKLIGDPETEKVLKDVDNPEDIANLKDGDPKAAKILETPKAAKILKTPKAAKILKTPKAVSDANGSAVENPSLSSQTNFLKAK